MNTLSTSSKLLMTLALMTGVASGSVVAQTETAPEADVSTTVYTDSAQMTAGPEIEGIISARNGDQLQITSTDGTRNTVTVNSSTRITASGGFLGLNRDQLGADQLLNGLPVKVDTLQGGGGLVASKIDLKNRDLRTAEMIRNGTSQRFEEQTAATDALRARMGDIDKYNIKSTTNVNFDTGKAVLSPMAKQNLCATAAQAEATENALLLVVGYTDSTGDPEFNQTLSEKRAASVLNYLQQTCKWKPYRMLAPAGMSLSDPVADNSTPEGKAQNRRVEVHVLVSKAVDGA
ncbi:outer membrane protein OmpA-like peptidoglycan-associated protein [Sphingobium sp. B11D3B]|uniref:OmpA family protein n=1 Tax=Sphingobium sp. B11D3B TaxID=2940575 RepID=UPI00222730C7|nr:OmpA family protein [Sphingobium sp. B11D3B]MCW2388495.1 outer membrane protein OmpA-like peptidoglycan-associated protein [Sphingobium sp. B11D3B]